MNHIQKEEEEINSSNFVPILQQNSSSNEDEYTKKKNIFEVIHKKEIIYTKFQKTLYKCIYCGKKYKNNNRIETHMRVHVSLSFIKFFYRLEKSLLNAFSVKNHL
jgi:uncharacterized Zn-finger protein